MYDLLYTVHLDDEPYPYWVGVSSHPRLESNGLSHWSKILSAHTGPSFAQNTTELEYWCHTFVRRGYDFRVHHDAFNGSHQVFMFMGRVDAIRFSLLEIMTNRIVTS